MILVSKRGVACTRSKKFLISEAIRVDQALKLKFRKIF